MFSISENYDAQSFTSANILIIFSNKYFNFSLIYLYFLNLLGKHQHKIIWSWDNACSLEHYMFSRLISAICLLNAIKSAIDRL